MVNKAFTPCIDAVSIPVEGGGKTKNDADNKSSIKTWRVKMIYFQFLKLLKVMKVWISKRCHYYSSCVLISMLELASLCCVTDF